MTSISVYLGRRIQEIRRSKNIKQSVLAEMIDMEPTNLSKIEKGIHLPKDETVDKIIKALDIDIKTLLSFEYKDTADACTRDELIKNINEILVNSKTEDIKFFYRVLISYNEIP